MNNTLETEKMKKKKVPASELVHQSLVKHGVITNPRVVKCGTYYSWERHTKLRVKCGRVKECPICYERTAVLWAEERILKVRGTDPEEQLVRWLQETYMQLESGLWLTAAATNVVVEGEMVKGTLHGEAIDPARHTLHSEIKAITYHGMKIVREHGLWRTTVVVDV